MKVLLLMLFSTLITGCTVNMNASKPPIPAADPILASKNIPVSIPVKKVDAPQVEIIEPSYTATPVAQPVVSVTNSVVDTKVTAVQPVRPTKVVVHKPEVRMPAPRKIVHTGTPATVVQANLAPLFYIVKPKDTVFEVMRQTGIHWKKIIELNQLKSPAYTIHPGQHLRVK